MYKLFVFNVLTQAMELMQTWEVATKDLAVTASRDYLLTNGMRSGNLVGPDDATDVVLGFVEQPSIAEQSGGYGCALNIDAYFYFREMARKYAVKSVLDLGSGQGNVLMAARATFGQNTRLAGVEIDPALLKVAERVLPKATTTLVKADVMTWKPKVNDFDLVYMYEPRRDRKQRLALLEHLKGWMTVGQKLYYKRSDDEPVTMPKWLTPLGGDLFAKAKG